VDCRSKPVTQIADTAASGPLAPWGHVTNKSTRWSGVPEPIGFGWAGGEIDRTARGAKEHSFQLGNDRVVLVGSNYGTFRLRQDEGGPKWLTDADADAPDGHLHGGGFGYLFQPAGSKQTLKQPPILSTAYTGAKSDRRFGIGYAETSGDGPGWKVCSPTNCSISAVFARDLCQLALLGKGFGLTV
jgi:hypothetical protein